MVQSPKLSCPFVVYYTHLATHKLWLNLTSHFLHDYAGTAEGCCRKLVALKIPGYQPQLAVNVGPAILLLFSRQLTLQNFFTKPTDLLPSLPSFFLLNGIGVLPLLKANALSLFLITIISTVSSIFTLNHPFPRLYLLLLHLYFPSSI